MKILFCNKLKDKKIIGMNTLKLNLKINHDYIWLSSLIWSNAVAALQAFCDWFFTSS
jgi:hypothetical protein